MSNVVLDASALLALLNDETGSDRVAEVIPGAAISAVNLSEVVAKLTERGMPGQAVRRALAGIELEIHDFVEGSAFRTGFLRSSTRSLGLSFGDRACIALGQELGAPVLTTDRNWRDLAVGIEIQVIR